MCINLKPPDVAKKKMIHARSVNGRKLRAGDEARIRCLADRAPFMTLNYTLHLGAGWVRKLEAPRHVAKPCSQSVPRTLENLEVDVKRLSTGYRFDIRYYEASANSPSWSSEEAGVRALKNAFVVGVLL